MITCRVEEAGGVKQSGVDLARPPVPHLPAHVHAQMFRPKPEAQPVGAPVGFPSGVRGD